MVRKAIVPLLLASVLLSGCCCPWSVRRAIRSVSVSGSGQLVTKEFDFDQFTAVNVSHAFKADIVQAERYSVVITIDDNLVQYLKVEQRGSVLYISLDDLSWTGDATLRAQVTLPNLQALEASGASQVSLSGFQPSRRFDMEVSGASSIRGELNGADLKLRISGASTVTLDGEGANADIGVSGASRARLENLVLHDVDVEATGASTAVVNVAGRLNAEASGASNIQYLGNPSLGKVVESGASSVRPR